MPMPVSRTRSTTSPCSSAPRTVMCPPGGVYFAAFVSRFETTWLSRSASPRNRRPLRAARRHRACASAARAAALAISIAFATTSAQLDQLFLEFHLPPRNARHVEQVVHQARQVTHLALDHRALPFEPVARHGASSTARRSGSATAGFAARGPACARNSSFARLAVSAPRAGGRPGSARIHLLGHIRRDDEDPVDLAVDALRNGE